MRLRVVASGAARRGDDEADRWALTEPASCVLGHAEPVEAFLGYACRRHYHWIDNTLTEILTLFALLPEVLLPGQGGGDGRSGTRVGSPAPGRLAVMSITDRRVGGRKPDPTYDRNWNGRSLEANGADDEIDLMGVLGGWYRMVLEETPRKLPPRVTGPACALDPCRHLSCARARGYVSLTTIIRVLRAERKWIAHQPWLDLYAEELGDAHRALARAVGDSMWARPVGKCPNDQAPLYNTIGLDEITCRRCGATWTGVHLARLRLIHELDGTGQ